MLGVVAGLLATTGPVAADGGAPSSSQGELEEAEDGVRITVTIPGHEADGGGDRVVEIGEVVLDATPMVRFAASSVDADGPCFAWREARRADVAYDLSLLHATTFAITASLPPCRGASSSDAVGADDFAPSLHLEAVRLLPPPAFAVQPGNRPMAGKPSYLDGDVLARQPPTTVVLADGDGLVTVEATMTARVVEYWVDWDWDGASPIRGATGAPGRSVTGPHAQAPRPWRDGVAGNVPWTWQWSGPRTVAVLARWQVDATVPGLGELGTVLVDVGPSATRVQVRQAQAVRRS